MLPTSAFFVFTAVKVSKWQLFDKIQKRTDIV